MQVKFHHSRLVGRQQLRARSPAQNSLAQISFKQLRVQKYGSMHIGPAEHVNMAIQQLDQVTQQNAASADEIASTAGTLAMQANQLQQTIAFFKIGEAVSQPTRTTKPLREPIPLEPSSEDVADKAHPNVEKENGQRDETSFGYPFDLDQQEKDEDERDAEFERY